MTVTEHQAYSEMYEAHGAIARGAALAVEELREALDGGVPLDRLAAVISSALARVDRIYSIAATERERWAS